MSDSILILGGARSGKSRRALELAECIGGQCAFLATAEALDDEMADRISRHQQDRGSHWLTIEAPLDLGSAVTAASETCDVCLIDCLTLWLSNLMHHGRHIQDEIASLCDLVATAPIPIILVSNEVGFGLVPETPLGRTFRDEQGRLNQSIARMCDRVEFVVAGLPLKLKG